MGGAPTPNFKLFLILLVLVPPGGDLTSVCFYCLFGIEEQFGVCCLCVGILF